MSRRRALLRQVAGGFTPTSIGWHSLFWPEGPDFVALGLSDGAAVATWPNETSEADATQSTAGLRPAYTASSAAFNSKPAVTFDADWMSTGTFSANPTYPISIVTIGRQTVTDATRFYYDGFSTSNRNALYGGSTAGTFRIFAGGTESANISGRSTLAMMTVATFDGSTGNETLAINGAAAAFGGNAGSNTITGVTLGAPFNGAGSSANYLKGDIALFGIYSGTFTSDSLYNSFKSWVTSHYGITLS